MNWLDPYFAVRETFDRQAWRATDDHPPRGRVVEVIEFHPDARHTDPVVIYDRRVEIFDDLADQLAGEI